MTNAPCRHTAAISLSVSSQHTNWRTLRVIASRLLVCCMCSLYTKIASIRERLLSAVRTANGPPGSILSWTVPIETDEPTVVISMTTRILRPHCLQQFCHRFTQTDEQVDNIISSVHLMFGPGHNKENNLKATTG